MDLTTSPYRLQEAIQQEETSSQAPRRPATAEAARPRRRGQLHEVERRGHRDARQTNIGSSQLQSLCQLHVGGEQAFLPVSPVVLSHSNTAKAAATPQAVPFSTDSASREPCPTALEGACVQPARGSHIRVGRVLRVPNPSFKATSRQRCRFSGSGSLATSALVHSPCFGEKTIPSHRNSRCSIFSSPLPGDGAIAHGAQQTLDAPSSCHAGPEAAPDPPAAQQCPGAVGLEVTYGTSQIS